MVKAKNPYFVAFLALLQFYLFLNLPLCRI